MHNAGIYVEPYELNQVRRTVISGVLIGLHSAHTSTHVHVIKVLELQSLM